MSGGRVRWTLSDEELEEAVKTWLYSKTHLSDWTLTLGARVVSTSRDERDTRYAAEITAERES